MNLEDIEKVNRFMEILKLEGLENKRFQDASFSFLIKMIYQPNQHEIDSLLKEWK